MKIMVSACLTGENCKYNGGNNRSDKVLRLLAGNETIAVCPEQMGGLPTPRVPSEIRGGVVVANVKHFFTLLGNEFFTSSGKQFFTLSGNEIFTLYGKQFFTLPGKEIFTFLSGSRHSRQVPCQLNISGCFSR